MLIYDTASVVMVVVDLVVMLFVRVRVDIAAVGSRVFCGGFIAVGLMVGWWWWCVYIRRW